MLGHKIKKPLLPNIVKVEQKVSYIDKDGNEKYRLDVDYVDNSAPNSFRAYADAVYWCNQNQAKIVDMGDYFEVVDDRPSEAEIAARNARMSLGIAKRERAAEVERLTVEVNGKVFDADETSQARMSVAASSMTDYETNVWVLHDNSIVHVTKSELLDACRKARLAQSAIWTKPYEDASA